jgi:hypothetical protein
MPIATLASLAARKVQKKPSKAHHKLVYYDEQIRALEHQHRQLVVELNKEKANPPKNPTSSKELKHITLLQNFRHMISIQQEKIAELKRKQKRLLTNK